MGRSKFALVIGRQALISCCHYIVDEVLAMVYPWFAVVPDEEEKPKAANRRSRHEPHPYDNLSVAHISIKELNLRLRRLVHQSISDLIDPARYILTIIYIILLFFS